MSIDFQQFLGPAGALALSIWLLVDTRNYNKNLIEKFEFNTERLVSAFQAEVVACEERYKQVLDELLRMKDKQNG